MLSRQLLSAVSIPIPTALSLLPPQTHARHTRYHFPTDQHLSVGSALLQRTLICRHYSLYPTLLSVPLHTDPESGRPSFAAAATAELRDGCEMIADYNTSHHNPREAPPGAPAIVALAAVSAGRVGVDVVPTRHRGGDAQQQQGFLDGFDEAAGVFTTHELATVRAQEGGVGRQVRCLLLLWGLKEAWVKAVGTGIVGDLTRVEFRAVGLGWDTKDGDRWCGAEVWVKGLRQSGWWMEVTFVESEDERGSGEGWYLVVCCEQEKLGGGQHAAWRKGEWAWVDFERDIRKPWGGQQQSSQA